MKLYFMKLKGGQISASYGSDRGLSSRMCSKWKRLGVKASKEANKQTKPNNTSKTMNYGME